VLAHERVHASAVDSFPAHVIVSLLSSSPSADFDTEFENDAELTLADMEFKDEDTKWERDLKLKVLEIYNSKLDARIERKKFILERGLLERKEKKRSKEEREVYNNMRVFARFHSAEEHETFIQGLLSQYPELTDAREQLPDQSCVVAYNQVLIRFFSRFVVFPPQTSSASARRSNSSNNGA
jgi:hypothetical protein